MSNLPADVAYTVYPVGDRAVTIQWGEEISERINQIVLALFDRFREHPLPGVTDLVPAYNSLMLVHDPLYPQEEIVSAIDLAVKALEVLPAAGEVPHRLKPSRLVEIPICYDLTLGPDLPLVAATGKIPIEEVIQKHSERTYRVYMIGFMPGFPYMGTVDPLIATPRKKEPATHIPSGSVGIAGLQTGIYPIDSPGGWNIVGRTPLRLFDPVLENPVYLQPGDEVKFIPIPLDTYHEYTGR